jgi:NAD(P)-dependent dehydrogenase (short-subunit alcohol dehydrogenase family)
MENEPERNYNNAFTAILSGIKNLFKKQIPVGVLNPQDRLDGKTVLVDGASSGLGFAIATEIAKRGAKVIMACRSGIPEKGEQVKKLSGNSDVHMLNVDFTDIHSIGLLVDHIQRLFAPIDILICNAGVVPRKSRKTPQGLEEMFMVNYLSKFLYVNLLLEKNCISHISGNGIRIPRIIFVSSESHRNPREFDWNGFGIYKEYSIGKSVELYGYYKLLLTTYTVELSRRLNQNGQAFSVFALCPGPINSNIAREAPFLFQPLIKIVFSIFFRSPKKAAVPVIYLAASPDQNGKQLDYLFLMNRKEIAPLALDPAYGEKLWQKSEEIIKSLDDGH